MCFFCFVFFFTFEGENHLGTVGSLFATSGILKGPIPVFFTIINRERGSKDIHVILFLSFLCKVSQYKPLFRVMVTVMLET